jgi:vacuolar protein sorting-associated protein 35
MATPPAVEDQARLLDDALTVVRQQSHLMRKCLETPGKLMDALKCRYGAAYTISESRKLNAPAAQWRYLDLVLTGHRK